MDEQQGLNEINYDHHQFHENGDHQNDTLTLEEDDEFKCLYGHLSTASSYDNGNGNGNGGGGGDHEHGEAGSRNQESVVNLLWSTGNDKRERRDVSEFGDDGGVIGGENEGEAWDFSVSSNVKAQSELSNNHNNYTLPGHSNGNGSQVGGQSSGNFCYRSWDGLLCWPQAAEGTSVSLPCFKHFRGISYDESGTVTRLCEKGGFWQNTTDYSECVAKAQPTQETLAVGTHDMYFAGYCLSLIALAIAVVIFIVFKELRCLRNIIHTNLMLTYILADALWLITSIQSNIGHQTQASCVTFILLHYFHLTNFFWMFVEADNESGLYLYVLVVQTFMAENVKFRVYASIGWGLPLLVVIAWSVAKWLTHPITSTQRSESESEIPSCFWLNVNMYDWIYKLPAIIVLAANSIFLLQIMWVLITKLRSATNPETQQSRKAAKALIVLMPLLGITYVLVLRGSSQTPAYEITRALLLSTQGFIVALTFCFLNAEVRQALRHRWNRLKDMGPDWGCCEQRNNIQGMRDWPRSRTESIRLYTPTQTTPIHRKRESCVSDTMTTCMGPPVPTTAVSITSSANGSHSVQQQQQQQPLIVTATAAAVTTKTYNSMDNNSLL